MGSRSLSSPRIEIPLSLSTSLLLLSSSLSLSSTSSSSSSSLSSSSSSRIVGEYQREVLAKTPGLYQVPKLRNLRQKNYGPTDRQTDRIHFMVHRAQICNKKNS